MQDKLKDALAEAVSLSVVSLLNPMVSFLGKSDSPSLCLHQDMGGLLHNSAYGLFSSSVVTANVYLMPALWVI